MSLSGPKCVKKKKRKEDVSLCDCVKHTRGGGYPERLGAGLGVDLGQGHFLNAQCGLFLSKTCPR